MIIELEHSYMFLFLGFFLDFDLKDWIYNLKRLRMKDLFYI